MKEYFTKRNYKITYFCINLFLSLIMGWVFLKELEDDGNVIILLIGLAMFIFAILGLLSIFFDKLILGNDFVEVKRFFRHKRFYVKNIEKIIVRHNSAYVFSEGKTIHISQDFESWREVVSDLRLKIKQAKELN